MRESGAKTRPISSGQWLQPSDLKELSVTSASLPKITSLLGLFFVCLFFVFLISFQTGRRDQIDSSELDNKISSVKKSLFL